MEPCCWHTFERPDSCRIQLGRVLLGFTVYHLSPVMEVQLKSSLKKTCVYFLFFFIIIIQDIHLSSHFRECEVSIKGTPFQDGLLPTIPSQLP